MDDLIAEILQDLSDEIGNADTTLLLSKVRRAAKEVRRDRNYPSSYTEDMIVKDLENYYSNISELALYDYNQFGAEGQESHSENGISRTWKSRDECKVGVTSICVMA